jgi:hypothetical protein
LCNRRATIFTQTAQASIFAQGGIVSQATTVPVEIKLAINPNSKGVIPIAILTTESFDATTVDPDTVLLDRQAARPAGPTRKVT